MMFDRFLAKAAELLAKDEPFVTAQVVRFEAPVSGKPGDKAIIFEDGRMWGWIGGGCAQPVVIKEALKALADGQPRLIRISPNAERSGAKFSPGIFLRSMMPCAKTTFRPSRPLRRRATDVHRTRSRHIGPYGSRAARAFLTRLTGHCILHLLSAAEYHPVSASGGEMRMTMRRAGLMCLAAGVLVIGSIKAPMLAQSDKQGQVVKYNPTYATVKFAFGPSEPVARLVEGQILDTDTLNCVKDCAGIPPDKLELAKMSNLLTGPFYIEGAEPGDTLAIDFLEMHPNDDGEGEISPGFGAINWTNYTPMLNPVLPATTWSYPIDRQAGLATFTAHDALFNSGTRHFSVKIPLHPFLGCVGVAPALGETRDSLVPAEFGGNMDASESSVGNTLYLPVNVRGALVYVGDGHAAMGDGEIGGTAIEVPMHVQMRFRVIKGRKIDWPRWENQKELMAAGIYRPLDDCLRIAFTQLVGWIHRDYGLSEMDAYELLSKVATIHVAEMVDPNYVVVAKIDKKFLPPKKR